MRARLHPAVIRALLSFLGVSYTRVPIVLEKRPSRLADGQRTRCGRDADAMRTRDDNIVTL